MTEKIDENWIYILNRYEGKKMKTPSYVSKIEQLCY